MNPAVFNYCNVRVVDRADPSAQYERVASITFEDDAKSRDAYQRALFVRTATAIGYEILPDGRVYKHVLRDYGILCDFIPDGYLEFLPDFEYVRLRQTSPQSPSPATSPAHAAQSGASLHSAPLARAVP